MHRRAHRTRAVGAWRTVCRAVGDFSFRAKFHPHHRLDRGGLSDAFRNAIDDGCERERLGRRAVFSRKRRDRQRHRAAIFRARARAFYDQRACGAAAVGFRARHRRAVFGRAFDDEHSDRACLKRQNEVYRDTAWQ